MSVWKRLKRIAAWTVVALLLLIGVLLVVIQTSTFQQWILRRAESFAKSAGITVTAQRLDLDIWNLRATLDGFDYNDGKGTRAAIRRISIAVPLQSWNADPIVINDLQVEGLQVNIEIPEFQNPQPSSPASVQGPAAERSMIPRLVLRNAVIEEASLKYTSGSTVVEIPSAELRIKDNAGNIQLHAPVSLAPDTRIDLPIIPFSLSDSSLRLDSTHWAVQYADLKGAGSVRGALHWEPSLGFTLAFATDPFTYQGWKSVQSSGQIEFENGVLEISDFRASRLDGMATGTARLSADGNQAELSWKGIDLAPAGVPATTQGAVRLQWKNSDFNDAFGSGTLVVASRQYGRIQSDIAIQGREATANITANGMDTLVRAKVRAGLDKAINGTFRASNKNYGGVDLAGRFRGNLSNSFVIDAAARAMDTTVRTSIRLGLDKAVAGRFVAVYPKYGGIGVAGEIAGNLGKSVSVDATGSAMNAAVRATIGAGMDKSVNGTFSIAHREYGDIDLNGNLSGTLDDPVIDATITARNVTYGDIGPLNASAIATLRSKAASVTDLRVQVKDSEVPEGGLRIDLDSQVVEGEIPRVLVELADFVPDATGEVSANATLSGTLQKPLLQFSGGSDGFSISGTKVESARVEGGFADGEVRIRSIEAHQGTGVLRADATYDLSSDQVEANINIDRLPIVQIPDLSTTVFLKGRLSGNLQSPSGTFEGRAEKVVYQGEEHGNIAFEATSTADRAIFYLTSNKYSAGAVGDVGLRAPFPFTVALAANNSEARYQQFRAEIDGGALVEGEASPFVMRNLLLGDFKVRGEGIDLLATGTLTDGVNVDLTADLSRLPFDAARLGGTARLNAIISGNIENPRVEGKLETSDATLQTTEMTEPVAIQAAVDFNRDEFTIKQMQASYSGANAEVTGHGTLKGTGEFEFRAREIRPERLFQNRPLTGLVELEGTIAVASPAIQDIIGHVRVTTLELNARDTTITQTNPIEVSLENQILTVQSFQLEGPNTQADLTGRFSVATQTFGLNLSATTNLRFIEGFAPSISADGKARTEIAAEGTLQKPNLKGFVNVEGARFEMTDPDVTLSEVETQIQFDGDRVEIVQAKGKTNGGEFNISGSAGLSSDGLHDVAMEFAVTKVALEYPEGLQSEVSAKLALRGAGTNLELTGDVEVLGALYRQNINLTRQVLSMVTNRSASVGTTQQAMGLLETTRLDVGVRTPGVVAIENNLANFEMTGDFRVRGTVANPILLGRAAVLEGGELYFGPQISQSDDVKGARRDRYIIQQGVIIFNNPVRTEPDVDFQATHELKVGNERYLVTLRAYGTPARLKTELTSDPALSETDIAAMLLTGRPSSELQGAYLDVAQEQFASYLSGKVSGLFQSAGSAIGLDMVSIEPVMVAGHEDLTARLTLKKDITPDFSLIFSQTLAHSGDQTWIASYETIKSLQIRGINVSEDNTIALEVAQDLRWGGGPGLPRRVRPKDEETLEKISFEGTTLPEKELRSKVTREGEKFNAYRMNADVRKLKEYFLEQDYPDVRVTTERTSHDGKVDLKFLIEDGPKVTFDFEGAKLSKSLRKELRQVWARFSGEKTELRESQARILQRLRDDGYLQATVDFRDESSDEKHRHFVFEITPGTKRSKPVWVFKGIDEPITITDSAGTVMARPEAIKERVETNLRSKGFLDATATEPQLILEDKPRFEVSVSQGKRYDVTRIDFEGNQFFNAEKLTQVALTAPAEGTDTRTDTPAKPGILQKLPFPFTSEWVETTSQRVTSEYWRQGFNNVQVVPSVTSEKDRPEVAVKLTVTEGEQQFLQKIQFEGADLTDPPYVRRQFAFKEGDPLDISRINLTRKRLYDTRLFKRVDIDTVQIGSGNDYIADVKLNEQAPWRFRYGVYVENRRDENTVQLGGTVEPSYANLFGKGILVGLRLKTDAEEREARLYGSLPILLGKDVTTTASVFTLRDTTADPIALYEKGVLIEQLWKLKDHYNLSYDYTFKKNRSIDPRIPNAEDPWINISEFGVTLTRDTRDDILNAKRGTFLSNHFAIAPPGLGSTVNYFRNYTQFFRFKPVRSHKNLIWATALKGGFAKEFGGTDDATLRNFRIGGGTTGLGLNPNEDEFSLKPGTGLFIVSQELRFPLFWRFSAAASFDAGLTYDKFKTIEPLQFRYSPAVGIRIQTPVVLVRFDFGRDLGARNNGESGKRWAFGIGQSF